MVGDIQPLVALIHGWWDNAAVTPGGSGATTTGDTVAWCNRPCAITSYDVVAVSAASPAGAPTGSFTVKAKVVDLPGARRWGALVSGLTVQPDGAARAT